MVLRDMRNEEYTTYIAKNGGGSTLVRLSTKGRLSFSTSEQGGSKPVDLNARLTERMPMVAYAMLAGDKPERDRIAEVTQSWRRVVTGQDYAQANGVEGGLPPSMRKLAKSKAVIHHLRALDRGETLSTKQKQQVRGFISSVVNIALFVGRYAVPEGATMHVQNYQAATLSSPRNFVTTQCRVVMDETAPHTLFSTVTKQYNYEKITLHATVTPRWFRQIYLRGVENIHGFCVMDILDRNTALVVDQRKTRHGDNYYVDGKHFFLRKQTIPNIGEGVVA
jgi:hypothetical protein